MHRCCFGNLGLSRCLSKVSFEGMKSVLFLLVALLAVALCAREVELTLDTPDSGWSVQMREVWKTPDGYEVLSVLSHGRGMMHAQMITKVSDKRTFEFISKEAQVVHNILGKTWGWENSQSVHFLKNQKMFYEKMKKLEAERVWSFEPSAADAAKPKQQGGCCGH